MSILRHLLITVALLQIRIVIIICSVSLVWILVHAWHVPLHMMVRLHSPLLVSASLALHSLVRVLGWRLIDTSLNATSLLAWHSTVTSSLVDLAGMSLLISRHWSLVDLLVTIVSLMTSSHHLVSSTTSGIGILISHSSSVWRSLCWIWLSHLILILILIAILIKLLISSLRLGLHVVTLIWVSSSSCCSTSAPTSSIIHTTTPSSVVGLVVRISSPIGISWLLVLLWSCHSLRVALVV